MNKKLLLLAMLQSISCLEAEQGPEVLADDVQYVDSPTLSGAQIKDFEFNRVVSAVKSDIKSVVKIGSYTAAGAACGVGGFVATSMAAMIIKDLVQGEYSFPLNVEIEGTAILSVSALALLWLAKKSYEKSWNMYKNMKTTTGKKVAACTAGVTTVAVPCALYAATIAYVMRSLR